MLSWEFELDIGWFRLPHSAGHAPFYAVQDMSGFLGYEHTLLSHMESHIHQHPKAFPQSILNRFGILF